MLWSFVGRAASLAMSTALVLSLGSVGCGRTACLAYTKGEYEQHGGSCPAQRRALTYFSNPDCPSPISSVDSAGSWDGELCCYSVTQDDSETSDSCDLPGFGAGGGLDEGETTGGEGVSVGVSTGVGGAGGFSGSSVGSGGAGGAPPCLHCGMVLNIAMSDPSMLCAGSAPLWNSLTSCACSAGACASACGDSFCNASSRSPACDMCFADPTGCSGSFDACMADI